MPNAHCLQLLTPTDLDRAAGGHKPHGDGDSSGQDFTLNDLEGNKVHFDNARDFIDAARNQQWIVEHEYMAGGRGERIQMEQHLLETMGGSGVQSIEDTQNALAGHTVGDIVQLGGSSLVDVFAGDHAADQAQHLLDIATTDVRAGYGSNDYEPPGPGSFDFSDMPSGD